MTMRLTTAQIGVLLAIATGIVGYVGGRLIGERPPSAETWRVIRIVDGDTLVLECRPCGHHERVRLADVDCPERGQPGAEAAAALLHDMVAGAELRLEPAATPRDRWDRLVAFVWADGRLVNAELVRGGVAVYWPHDGRHAAEMAAGAGQK